MADNKCKRVAQKYTKALQKNCFAAFSIGYADGEAGRPQKIPEVPQSATGTLYAALLLANELYKDGYKTGKKD